VLIFFLINAQIPTAKSQPAVMAPISEGCVGIFWRRSDMRKVRKP